MSALLRRIVVVGGPQDVAEAAALAGLDQHPVRRREGRVELVRVGRCVEADDLDARLAALVDVAAHVLVELAPLRLLVGVERHEHARASTPGPARAAGTKPAPASARGLRAARRPSRGR